MGLPQSHAGPGYTPYLTRDLERILGPRRMAGLNASGGPRPPPLRRKYMMNPPAPPTNSPSGGDTAVSRQKVPLDPGQRTGRAQAGRRTESPGRPRAGAPMGFILYACTELTLVCLPPGLAARHSLDDAAHLTGVHPEMLRYYCRLGLLDAHPNGITGEPTFDDDALREIGRIEHFRRNLGVSRRALPLICQLRRECERMQIRLSFLSDTWPGAAEDRRT